MCISKTRIRNLLEGVGYSYQIVKLPDRTIRFMKFEGDFKTLRVSPTLGLELNWDMLMSVYILIGGLLL